jgi:hypothetical protein
MEKTTRKQPFILKGVAQIVQLLLEDDGEEKFLLHGQLADFKTKKSFGLMGIRN